MADHAHLLAEIKENIARKDPIKARLVLAYLFLIAAAGAWGLVLLVQRWLG